MKRSQGAQTVNLTVPTREMIAYLVSAKGIPRDEAYILTSLAVDLHVTQLVDGTKGIHAMVAKSLFQ